MNEYNKSYWWWLEVWLTWYVMISQSLVIENFFVYRAADFPPSTRLTLNRVSTVFCFVCFRHEIQNKEGMHLRQRSVITTQRVNKYPLILIVKENPHQTKLQISILGEEVPQKWHLFWHKHEKEFGQACTCKLWQLASQKWRPVCTTLLSVCVRSAVCLFAFACMCQQYLSHSFHSSDSSGCLCLQILRWSRRNAGVSSQWLFVFLMPDSKTLLYSCSWGYNPHRSCFLALYFPLMYILWPPSQCLPPLFKCVALSHRCIHMWGQKHSSWSSQDSQQKSIPQRAVHTNVHSPRYTGTSNKEHCSFSASQYAGLRLQSGKTQINSKVNHWYFVLNLSEHPLTQLEILDRIYQIELSIWSSSLYIQFTTESVGMWSPLQDALQWCMHTFRHNTWKTVWNGLTPWFHQAQVRCGRAATWFTASNPTRWRRGAFCWFALTL